MPFIEQLGMQTAGNVLGAGMGLILGGIERKKQLEQQQKLQNMEIAGQKQMGIFNREQQMKLWEDTNYGAQVQQLKKAGLNPGLLYGKGGPGGITNASPGSISGGQASPTTPASGMGMMMGQAAMQAAQIRNLDANTKLTEVEAGKKAGVDTKLGETQISSLLQGIESAKSKQALTEVETALASIKEHIAGATQNIEISKIIHGAEIVANDAEISTATKEDKIRQIKAEAIANRDKRKCLKETFKT